MAILDKRSLKTSLMFLFSSYSILSKRNDRPFFKMSVEGRVNIILQIFFRKNKFQHQRIFTSMIRIKLLRWLWKPRWILKRYRAVTFQTYYVNIRDKKQLWDIRKLVKISDCTVRNKYNRKLYCQYTSVSHKLVTTITVLQLQFIALYTRCLGDISTHLVMYIVQ